MIIKDWPLYSFIVEFMIDFWLSRILSLNDEQCWAVLSLNKNYPYWFLHITMTRERRELGEGQKYFQKIPHDCDI